MEGIELHGEGYLQKQIISENQWYLREIISNTEAEINGEKFDSSDRSALCLSLH
jgi:hypothetical protein